jgi:hypothetical protein
MTEVTTEDFLPVLSAGKHRSARRGACFMEYASYLAGERWSDRPSCTHPTLAALARLVNDLSGDNERSKLSILIPSVVGLNGDDPRVTVIVCALAASAALPVASMSRQRALAAALLRCEHELRTYEGPEVERALQRIGAAFLLAPGTEDWASDFMMQTAVRNVILSSTADDTILRTAAIGIADACIEDPDARLAELLEKAIEECASLFAPASIETREIVLV